jgi:hypothetical protein
MLRIRKLFDQDKNEEYILTIKSREKNNTNKEFEQKLL